MAKSFTWTNPTKSGDWTLPASWTDTTDNTQGTLAPGAADTATIDGGPGTTFQIVAGPGAAAQLSAPGNNAFDGSITTGSLIVGELTAIPGLDNSDALDIDRGAALTATGAATVYSNLEIDGGSLQAGTFNVAAGASDTAVGAVTGAVVVVNGGSLRASAITFNRGSLIEDANAAIEVGNVGGAALGSITVDPGAVLTIGGIVTLNQAIADNGDVLVANTTASGANLVGNISGTGMLETGANAKASLTNSTVNGLARVHLAQNSTVSFFGGAITNVGAVVLDSGSTLNAQALTNDGPITVGTGATLSIAGTLSGASTVSMGTNAIFDLSGQDTNVPIILASGGDIELNLSAGSNVGGAVSGFDKSDLIENRPTTGNTDIINGATYTPGAAGAAGTLTLLSDTVTTIALAGNYAGQRFLTNFTGIVYGNSDITLPGAFINGIGSGTQTITGGAFRSFSLVTGGGAAGALTLTANLALDGAYAAASLVTTASTSGTDDTTDILANSSMAISGNATVQTNLQLTGAGSAFAVGGTLTIGGGTNPAEPQIILAGTSRLTAANIVVEGSTAQYQLGSNTIPDLAALGNSVIEIGGGSLATAGTLAIDPGATLTLAVNGGEIVAGTIIDDGLITMRASPQGTQSGAFQSSLSLSANVTGTGTLQPYGSLIITGGLTGLAVNAAQNSSLTVNGAVSGLQSLTIGASANVNLYSLAYSKPIEVGASATFSVGGSADTGVTTGITSLTVDANASAKFSGPVNTVGPITVAAGGKLEFDRTASGTGAIALGTSVTLTDLGQITGWSGITLAGQDNISTYNGATIAPTISGFDTSDDFQLTSGTIKTGGVYYTGATWTQGANNTGTLALTLDGQILQTYTLAGNYTGQTFITYAGGHVLGTGVGSSSTTLAFATQSGLNGTAVSGVGGGGFLLLSGSGTQSALTLTNNVAIAGAFTLGTLQLGTNPAPANTNNAVLVEAGGLLAASTATVDDVVEADGPGASFSIANTVTMNNVAGGNALIAYNGAAIQVGATSTSTAYDFDTVCFSVDATGSIEVGHAGGAAGGKVTVDAGSTLHSSSGFEMDAVNGVVLNGTWVADNLASNLSGFGAGISNDYLLGGNITGTGALQVGANTFVTIVQSVAGLGSVAVLGAGGFDVSGSLLGIGAVSIAAGGSISLKGVGTSNFSANTLTLADSASNSSGASFFVQNNAAGTGALSIGAHDSFNAGGTVSGWSAINVGAYGSLTVNGAEQASPINLGANTTLGIGTGATVSGVVTGFAKGDSITYGANQAGSPIITGATWSQTTATAGTLTLTSDSVVEAQLTLAGNYANERFLTNEAGEPGGTFITLADQPPYISPDPLFDAVYYLANNPDVAAAGVDPYQHYITTGWKEGRNPSALFNTNYYEQQNPDVRAAGVNPLLHFETSGWKEGRNPSVLFDTNDYLAANPDVAAAGVDPLLHYVLDGKAEGRAAFAVPTLAPDPLVNAAYVYAERPDVKAAGVDASQWFDTEGWKENANPNPDFDTNYYLTQNPDVRAAGINPLLHFETSGWREGRDPSLLFSDSGYLAANPDVRAAGIDPLQHYFANGQAEGRAAFLSGGLAAADPLVNAAYYDTQLGATLIPSGTSASQQAAYSYETTGWTKGLNPDAFFNTAYYLSHNPDVAAAHVDPLLQYETYGWKEGRDPSAQFSTNKYLAAYADVKAAGVDPLLQYVTNGQAEGRQAFAV